MGARQSRWTRVQKRARQGRRQRTWQLPLAQRDKRRQRQEGQAQLAVPERRRRKGGHGDNDSSRHARTTDVPRLPVPADSTAAGGNTAFWVCLKAFGAGVAWRRLMPDVAFRQRPCRVIAAVPRCLFTGGNAFQTSVGPKPIGRSPLSRSCEYWGGGVLPLPPIFTRTYKSRDSVNLGGAGS